VLSRKLYNYLLGQKGLGGHMYDLALKALSKLGDWAFNLLNQSKEETDEAAFALREAVTETQIFLGQISRSDELQGDAQEKIARLWSDASSKFRHIDRNVSDQCYELSRQLAFSKNIDERELIATVERIFESGRHYQLID
jgi:hypothetical protein